MVQRLYKLLPIFILVFVSVHSQELPPIQIYSPVDYNGENQNWVVSQSEQKLIYTANNHHLLEFDGEKWRKYPSVNGSVIHALAVSKDFVYTGSYMEFGYWSKNKFGALEYQSLIPSLKVPLLEEEQFWNILTIDTKVLFQSLKRIYSYDLIDKTFKVFENETKKAKIFNLKEGIYVQKNNAGLYKIANGKLQLVTDNPIVSEKSLIGLFEREGELLILLEDADFYILDDEGTIKPWSIAVDAELESINLFSSLQLDNGDYILGTISNGLYHLSKEGKLLYNINQRNGLQDNTVLSVYEDRDNNIWLGHDNGLSILNLQSPFKEYVDNAGKIGVVYTSKLFNGYLYLGTNQGLFYKSTKDDSDFRFIKGTEGQVWNLINIEETLFCGHNKGTYVIQDNTAVQISDVPGTWDIKPFEQDGDFLIQGNYNGLSILEKIDGTWRFKNVLEGFGTSSRFFEFTDANEVLVNNEYKGIFRLQIDATKSKVKVLDRQEVRGHGSSITTYMDKLLYASNNGIFDFDPERKDFELDSTLTDLFYQKNDSLYGILIKDDFDSKLWSFTTKGLTYVEPDKFGGKSIAFKITFPTFLKNNLGVSGFENIQAIAKESYLIGTSNGYVTLNLDKIRPKVYEVDISSVSKQFREASAVQVPLISSSEDFKFSENNILFTYAVPEYFKYKEVNYQYKLEGLYENWSGWSTVPEISFENLPFGSYVFKVRASIGGVMSSNESSYDFKIAKPWYWSNSAVIGYVLLLLFISFCIHKRYKTHYQKKQEFILKENKRKIKRKKIKSQKEIVQIKNEKLRQEIEAKNRELAVSTMSIIKKNKFLNTVKDQLKLAEKEPSKIRSVIRTIDNNINNEDDWKFFEEAFNNADKNFLKKIKDLHSELTSNDLRLCAYLRLNLSSKEIAPLLNISVRSVEVKRYRLRKKMDLEHETGLSEYLLSI